MTWLKWLSTASVLLIVVLVALSAYGTARWRGLTDALNTRLEAARKPPTPARYDVRELEGLPAPVQRYFRAVLTDGAPMVAAASFEHVGTFNMGESADQWKPFTSTQRVVTQSPGFVWDGSVTMLPGLAVRVHDAYVGGEGILHPAILGLFTLVDMRGAGEIAQGELLRYFAEAVWYPTALLPSQGVHWEAVDEQSARATLVDGPLRVTMTFRFGAEGLMTSCHADARGYAVAGKVIPMPWEGRFSNYRLQGGMRVPMTGEVAWRLPQGDKPYWRGTLVSMRHEFAP